jgi:hypothetical protein
MKLDYSLIKKCIIKSCKQNNKVTLDFQIDANKLDELVSQYGVTFIYNGILAKPVMAWDIPLISEYFKKQKLSWFNRSRYYTTLSFIVTESLDKEGLELLENLKDKNRENDPNFDRVATVSKLLADYPCYNATIVSYRSDDPNRLGKNSYTIVIRANVNVISSPDYEYNNQDI